VPCAAALIPAGRTPHLGVLRVPAPAGLIIPAGKGYQGAGGPLITPGPRPEQARLPEGREEGPCPAMGSRRASERPVQGLAHPALRPLAISYLAKAVRAKAIRQTQDE
jgi:hypothetical protein